MKSVLFRIEMPVTPSVVAVAFVKIPVEADDAPIVVPLMVPPLSVTFPELRFVTVPFVTRAVVAKKFVEVVFVPVALVQVMLVGLIVVAVKLVALRFVAKRFVAVALVKVPEAKYPFHRSVSVPKVWRPVIAGFRLVWTDPVTPRFEEVELVKTAAAALVRPIVTALMVPPLSVTFPLERLVTRALVAKKCVEVVFVPVALVQVMLVGLKEPAVRFVKEPSTAKRRVPVALVKLSVDTVEEPALKFPVSTRLVPEALVKVAVWRPVVPVTTRFEIVAPPYSVREEVAIAPRFVTERRVSLSVKV